MTSHSLRIHIGLFMLDKKNITFSCITYNRLDILFCEQKNTSTGSKAIFSPDKTTSLGNIFFLIFLKKLQVSNAKTKGNFFQKKSWSQMIQNCLIRREMAKKNSAAAGGFRRQLRYRRRFFSFSYGNIQF